MQTSSLPPHDVMVRAMLHSDRAYEGLFYTAVRTTGIFCRPTCHARKPLPENVLFFQTAGDALSAGFRPCLRCKPLDASGTVPGWVTCALKAVDRSPNRRWVDADFLALGLEPLQLRRWFKEHFGTTFHAHIRARRLAAALGTLTQGTSIDDAAWESGYQSLSGFREAVSHTLRTTPGRAREAVLLLYSRVLTPLGPMIAMAEPNGLVLLEFVDRPALLKEIEELRSRYRYVIAPGQNNHLQAIEQQLTAFFEGKLQSFTVPLVTPGAEFQKRVWRELRRIPYGTTTTYGRVADALGSPGASRAVGLANGQNRLAVVIPCHRVIGADGSLTGYGGGQPRKAFLLELERRFSLTPGQQKLF